MNNSFLEDLVKLDSTLNDERATYARITLWDIELIISQPRNKSLNILQMRKNPIDLLDEYIYYKNERKTKRASNAELVNLI